MEAPERDELLATLLDSALAEYRTTGRIDRSLWRARHPDCAAELFDLLETLAPLELAGAECRQLAAQTQQAGGRGPFETLPSHIGRYRLLSLLAAGGMGAVYKAEDPQLRRPVAVKVPRFEGSPQARAAAQQRFEREALAFSPDGTQVRVLGRMSWGLQGAPDEFCVWDAATGAQLARLTATGCIDAAHSPDGAVAALATGINDDWTWQFWDVATGRLRSTVRGSLARPRIWSFSRDGRVAFAGRPGRPTIFVWDTQNGKELTQLEVPGGGVALAADGRRIARYGQSGPGAPITVKVVALATGKEVALLEAKVIKLNQFALSADGRYLAAAYEYYTDAGESALLWDLGAEKREPRLLTPPHGAAVVAFAPDSKTLAVLPGKGAVAVHDTATGARRGTLGKEDRAYRAIAFSPDGRRAAAASKDGAVTLWDVASGKQLNPETDPVTFLAVTADGKTLAVPHGPGEIHRLDVLSGKRESLVDLPPGQSFTAAEFSPSGRWLLVNVQVPGSGRLAIVDTTAGDGVKSLEATAAAFAPDEKTLAELKPQGVLADLLHTADWKSRANVPWPRDLTSEPRVLTFAQGGKAVAVGVDGAVWLFDAQTGRHLRTLQAPNGKGRLGLSANPASGWLAYSAWSGGDSDHVRLWDRDAKAYDLATPVAAARGLCLSPDGRLLACDHAGRVIEWAAGQVKRQWQLPGVVRRIALTRDGRHLLTSNQNGTVYVLRLTPLPGG